MLQELHIQNYAIIDDLVIRFDAGLNIITGETGAGKSILMGALSLILGERADSSMVLNKDKKCFVEGVFLVSNKPGVIHFLEENDLDINAELVIRREIAVNGKSRAFVNDTPVTLGQLQALTSRLVDLHHQFDTLSLADTGFQLTVVDAMSGNEHNLARYRKSFRAWQDTRRELTVLQERKDNSNREQDYHRFLYNELEEASFKPDELEGLEDELKLLNSAEGIKSALTNVYEHLKGQETPLVQVLKQMHQQLQPFVNPLAAVADLSARIQACYIELADIAEEAEHQADKISHDAGRIEEINERLNTGYRLLKKHGVQTTRELLALMDELSVKLLAIEQLDDQILALQKQLQASEADMLRLADSISAARKKQVPSLEKQVNELLARVGMPNARLKVQLDPAEPSISGTDAIDFLFDGNKSNQFSSLRKVASGGELSRLMLCIKSLVAGKIDLPTLIFDEIDTGISGEASRQVGLIMKELAAARQVICITHQPQIAGKADRHLFVFKQAAGKTISTNIRELDREERITAIAQMLSGEKPTAAAMENAREMIMK
ncbi:DNA repair protein RecN [Flavihumibacter stibioxidans]|uniref:DNA repair protein RecN n=1 Tax=Flavihumibacter stibioxidans TaxID=1834163 RepID=A0ABR7M6Z2_9BACT|nr:DNA repair protein RecN [Flavihumibacter stibioxidans]MBC6490299.1 DNA repair protein RecN [Flavihumibacter stibioxidans]